MKKIDCVGFRTPPARGERLSSALLVSIERGEHGTGIIINGMPGALMALRDMIDDALRRRGSTLVVDDHQREKGDTRHISIRCVSAESEIDSTHLNEQLWANRGAPSEPEPEFYRERHTCACRSASDEG